MGWIRHRYRGNKVWIEMTEGGAPVLDERGLARLRYKPEDPRTYSVRPQELEAVGEAEAGASVEAAPPGDARPAKVPRRPKAAVGKSPPLGTVESRDANEVDVPALAGLEIQAWTDGAASGNPGPAGAGVVLLFKEHRKEGSIYLGETTNNVAELTAVKEALQWIRQRELPVRVCTDSTYVIGVLTGAMKAKANLELVAQIRAEMRGFQDLHFIKVDAHCGVLWNERADALAREASRSKRSRVTGSDRPPTSSDPTT